MLTGIIRVLAINDMEITISYLENRFWEINNQFLNNYFKREDFPYFKLGGKDDLYFIVVDKMPDGSKPTKEYEYKDEDGALEIREGCYPFLVWLNKRETQDDDYVIYYSDSIFEQLQKSNEKKMEYYNAVRKNFLKKRVYYYLEIKHNEEKVAEMALLILYIIAEKINGVIHFMDFYYHNERVNHKIIQANSLLDKVVDYKEFFEIVKSIIERKD